MKIVEEDSLNRFFIKLRIISILLRGEKYFSELWLEMRKFVGSKATFVKYLRFLVENDVVEIYEKRVRNRLRRYYRLKDFEIEKFSEQLDKLGLLKESIDVVDLLRYLNMVILSSLIALEEFGKNWVTYFAFTIILLLNMASEDREIVGKVDAETLGKIFNVPDVKELETFKKVAKLFLKAIS